MMDFLKDFSKNRYFRYLIPAICVILCLVSIFALAPKYSVAKTYEPITKSLDDKRGTAIEISAVLAGASVAIAAVPGDATTPIADQIASMNSYLIIVIGAIMLEKYLLPIIGMLVFYIVFPIALILAGVYSIFPRKRSILNFSVLLGVLGVALMLIIPVGVKVGDEIDKAYGMATLTDNIKEDLKNLDSNSADSKESTSEKDSEKNSAKDSEKEEEEKNLWEQAKEFFSDTAESVTEGVTETASVGLENIKVILGDFLDAIAALIISTCIIPIIICLVFYWIAKALFKYFTSIIMKSQDENLPAV